MPSGIDAQVGLPWLNLLLFVSLGGWLVTIVYTQQGSLEVLQATGSLLLLILLCCLIVVCFRLCSENLTVTKSLPGSFRQLVHSVGNQRCTVTVYITSGAVLLPLPRFTTQDVTPNTAQSLWVETQLYPSSLGSRSSTPCLYLADFDSEYSRAATFSSPVSDVEPISPQFSPVSAGVVDWGLRSCRSSAMLLCRICQLLRAGSYHSTLRGPWWLWKARNRWSSSSQRPTKRW